MREIIIYQKNSRVVKERLDEIFIPYKGRLRLSELIKLDFNQLYIKDLLTINENAIDKLDQVILNIIRGLDNLGLACIIHYEIKDFNSKELLKIHPIVCKLTTDLGYKTTSEYVSLFFNGTHHQIMGDMEDLKMLLGISWSDLIDEKSIYVPREYVSFLQQQVALILSSYFEKEPHQYLIMQTEAMKRNIYAAWDSIYKDYMSDLVRQDINQYIVQQNNATD